MPTPRAGTPGAAAQTTPPGSRHTGPPAHTQPRFPARFQRHSRGKVGPPSEPHASPPALAIVNQLIEVSTSPRLDLEQRHQAQQHWQCPTGHDTQVHLQGKPTLLTIAEARARGQRSGMTCSSTHRAHQPTWQGLLAWPSGIPQGASSDAMRCMLVRLHCLAQQRRQSCQPPGKGALCPICQPFDEGGSQPGLSSKTPLKL